MFINHFLEYVKPQKHKYAFIMVLMLVESAVSLGIPYLVGQFSSAALGEPTAIDAHYSYFIGAWLALIVIQALVRYQFSFRINMIGANILSSLSCRLYDHVQMLPISYFSKRKKGEILALISNDANVLAYFLSGILTSLAPSLIIAVGSLILMASINVYLALIIAVCIPGFYLLLKLLGKRIRPLSEQVTEQQASIVAHASENIGAIHLLKSFGREQTESDKFKHNTEKMLELRRSQFHIQALLSPLVQMLISIGIVLIALVSVLHYRSGELTISELITLLMYGLLFAKPMSGLAATYGQYQQAQGASKRILDVLQIEPETIDESANELAFKQGHIQLENITFHYDGGKPLLANVNAEFKPDNITLLIGDNGAGKTTILHLLMRFIEPKQGRILLDDQDISKVSLQSLRSHIALVSQDVALSNGSIFENIAYGRPDTSLEQVVKAAKASGADRFINQLEDGYHAQVGENGVLLSAGQRQKISLARALLLNSRIIIFDEPTSASDEQGHEEFAALIKQLLAGRTVIIVTHDTNMQKIADKVYAIDRFEIVEK
ncbi:ABC transporter ATP-binding protein [Alteromonas sediminis]|uniref:ABC transporter ATP-binding protein n=1 Tax=Alteromonas sediminis TaxID=2259342 RepID=A0A3N5Y3D2_9ALTE|nr:ABC transporter ATP-binding protein [Alteromonas sediminis]RPJ68527.1 ABC transporter ATP-binding protein [Alteromonas sediminis]